MFVCTPASAPFGSPSARGYVDVCFAFPTDFPRGRGRRGRRSSTLAAAFGGALRAVHISKTERGGSVPNEFAPNLPRSVFRLAAGVAPSIGTLPLAGRGGAQAPRWWCCEGRRCRGSLTQLATIRFSLLPRPRATASRRPLATAFGDDLRSGHNSGLAFGEVSLASLGAFPLAFRNSFRVS